jgi:site-specific DNA-cytosine methylase
MTKQSTHITVTDQFCGAGGSSQGVRKYAERSGITTGLEVKLALNHWQLAIDTHSHNFPDTQHDCTDIQACDPRYYPSTTILVTSPECFPAGTLILTDRGNIPIEHVRAGDFVLTHMNRWQRVTSAMRKVAATVVVQGQGHPGLECTAEHPFYVRRQTRPWNNDLRRNVRHIADPEWMDAGHLADQDVRWATPFEIPGLNIPAVGGRGARYDEAFWWMVGRWLADGTVRLREGNSEITLACGAKKVPELRERLHALRPAAGRRSGQGEYQWRERDVRTATLFETGHDGLARWLVDHFGKLAHGKRIPVWALGMAVSWRQALLEGYLSGDGSVGIRRTQCSTVSKQLAIGLRLLATGLGYHVTLGLYDQHCDVIEGRKVNTRPQWMLTWENNRSQRTGWHDDRHAWSLVKCVKPGRPRVELFNLSVAQDESYVADGIVVHNCTNHSVAKGRKQVKSQLDAFATGKQDAAAERSRATMWDVVRFAEFHKYKVIITENVVDARAWILWDAWIMAMHNLGYQHQAVFYNSMFAWPTPQSRDRMYVVFWRKGQRKPDLDLRPWAPCQQCGPVQAIQRFKPKANVKAKYGTQYTYVCPLCAQNVMPFYFAAINAIDWTVKAERIGDRKKPLEERTMQRIAYGLKKYGNRPLSVTNYFSSGTACRVKDATTDPLFTQHSKAGTAVVLPFALSLNYPQQQAKSVVDPIDTVTANRPMALVSPVMVETKYSHSGDNRSKGADEPLAAQTGQQSVGVALPFVLDSSFTKAKGEYMSAGDEPIGTQTTTQSKSVVIPPALMVDTNYFTDHVRPVDGVLPSQTGANKMGFLTTLRGTDATAVKGTASGLDEPVGTISAGGVHHALITGKTMGWLSSYYGVATDGALDESMGTLSTRDRHALVHGAKDLRVEDLYFRMLKAHEVKAGMAFAPDYTVLGNQREQVKQLGNAVTPPVMEMLIERCVQSLM